MLKEVSAITENQLNELEEMRHGEVQRNKTNGEKIYELWAKIRDHDDEILKLKRELNHDSGQGTTP
jgi:hypothetical protein